MNALPQISHHLFAAAVGREARSRRPAGPELSAPSPLQGTARGIPLEPVLAAEATHPLPRRQLRPWAAPAGF